MKINYSIIIPHHNNPLLLKRLLNSISRRNDIEVIIVDDRSDNIYHKAIEDLEIQFINFTFLKLDRCGGGGYARNKGIEVAKGKYIIFADSDDFFLPSFDTLLDKYKDSIIDIIFFNAISLDSNTYSEAKRARHLNNQIDKYYKNHKKGNSCLRYLVGEPWCKIIKRQLIIENNIRFDEIPIHNDTKFSYQVGYYAKNITVESIRGYCVTDDVGSVSKSSPENKLFIRAEVFYNKNLFLNSKGIDIVDRQFLSPYWYFLKHAKIKCLFQFNKKLKLSLWGFIKMLMKTISSELRYL